MKKVLFALLIAAIATTLILSCKGMRSKSAGDAREFTELGPVKESDMKKNYATANIGGYVEYKEFKNGEKEKAEAKAWFFEAGDENMPKKKVGKGIVYDVKKFNEGQDRIAIFETAAAKAHISGGSGTPPSKRQTPSSDLKFQAIDNGLKAIELSYKPNATQPHWASGEADLPDSPELSLKFLGSPEHEFTATPKITAKAKDLTITKGADNKLELTLADGPHDGYVLLRLELDGGKKPINAGWNAGDAYTITAKMTEQIPVGEGMYAVSLRSTSHFKNGAGDEAYYVNHNSLNSFMGSVTVAEKKK